MNLLQISKAVKDLAPNHSILMYGPPKSGKTRLVATAASIPEVSNIYWFDIENGSETILHMGLPDSALEKITLFKIRDTRDNPIGIETMLKAMTSKKPIKICDAHGKVACAVCSKEREAFTDWSINDCTHNDLIVIDSGSALGDSALAATCLGQGEMFKPGWDEYGIVGKWLTDIMSVIQQATHTNFVMITHEIALEDDNGKDMFFPLVGSKAFCLKVGKYFGTVVYVDKKMNKHVAGSSSTYRNNVITGSRVNAEIEKAKTLDMRAILIEGGVLKEGVFETEERKQETVEQNIDVVKEAAPTGLAAILAAKKEAAALKRIESVK